jgi:hypothetical protein
MEWKEWAMEDWAFFVATASILILWVILPLIPAVLIYRLFPNAAVSIKGILVQGLTIKAGGAFAAYLIVLLVIKPWVAEAYDDVGGWLHPAWTITGTLRFIDKHGAVVHPGETFFQKIGIKTQPEMNSFADPTFTITVPEGPRGIPNVFLFVPDYSVTVPLKLGKMDLIHKTAEIDGDPIEIREPLRNDSDDRQPVIDPDRK